MGFNLVLWIGALDSTDETDTLTEPLYVLIMGRSSMLPRPVANILLDTLMQICVTRMSVWLPFSNLCCKCALVIVQK